MLVRLMYASRAVPAIDHAQISTILRQSRANNPASGVTGVLCCCFNANIFLQVLEGGRGAVNQLYNRITADPRHNGVELLLYEDITERQFAGWAMGQVDMGRLNPSLVLKYSAKPELDPFAVAGKVSLALFHELAATASVVGQP